jgi:hypothetical protein
MRRLHIILLWCGRMHTHILNRQISSLRPFVCACCCTPCVLCYQAWEAHNRTLQQQRQPAPGGFLNTQDCSSSGHTHANVSAWAVVPGEGGKQYACVHGRV